MQKVHIGIVGCGFAGRFHVECLRRIYGVEVVLSGVTSKRAESRQAFGRQHGIPVYDDVASMLDHVDILDVCSPPYGHEGAIHQAVRAGKSIICEKPLTGYFGPADVDDRYRGDGDSKQKMLDEVIARLDTLAGEIRKNKILFAYAENFVYTPSVQKEREIIEKTGAQLLRMTGEESHSGSASAVYGIWRYAGGGSLLGKGVHPLGAMLYLKRIEGLARQGQPIRPRAVTARTHQLTRLPDYCDAGLIRTDYHDVEDYGFIHVIFDDGTVADVLTSEVVLGGLYDYVEVFANNHRTRCQISPVHLVDTYNPRHEQYEEVYLVEKCSTQEGWSPAAPDENFTVGYQDQFQDFITSIVQQQAPQSGLDLALDTTLVTYSAYLSDEKKGAEVPVPRLG